MLLSQIAQSIVQEHGSRPQQYNYDEMLHLILVTCHGQSLQVAQIVFDTLLKEQFIVHLQGSYVIQPYTITIEELECDDQVTITESKVLNLPQGVITKASNCYAYLCHYHSCMSPQCPNRNALTTHELRKYVRDDDEEDDEIPAIWAMSVPKSIYDETEGQERNRQEVLYEIIKTEVEFKNDLQFLKSQYMEPLSKSAIIQADARDEVLSQIFGNLDKLIAVSSAFAYSLQSRQPIVSYIGDILDQWSQQLEVFYTYGSKFPIARHVLDQHMESNHVMEMFCKSVERKVQSRKLPIQSFLSRPTTRLGRYPLLLLAYAKVCQEFHPEYAVLMTVISRVKDVLHRIDEATGQTENQLSINDCLDMLEYRNHDDQVQLEEEFCIESPERVLVRHGAVKKRRGLEQMDLELYLFDNFLMLCTKDDKLHIYRKPIPINMLLCQASKSFHNRTSSFDLSRNDSQGSGDHAYFNLTCAGRQGFSLNLLASSVTEKQNWVHAINAATQEYDAKHHVFNTKDWFRGERSLQLLDRVLYSQRTCAVCQIGGYTLTSNLNGIYMYKKSEQASAKLLIDIAHCRQMEFVPQWQQLVVLCGTTVYSYQLNQITMEVGQQQRISKKSHFFEVGTCNEQLYLAAVRSSALNSKIKLYQYKEHTQRVSSLDRVFAKISQLEGWFSQVSQYLIPNEVSSLNFLQDKLCVGCARGFELLDIETFTTKSILTDIQYCTCLNVFEMADGTYLLCFQDEGVYCKIDGNVIKKVSWSCSPTMAKVQDDHLILFDPTMIQIRDLQTGSLQQVIHSQGFVKQIKSKQFLWSTKQSSSNRALSTQSSSNGKSSDDVLYEVHSLFL